MSQWYAGCSLPHPTYIVTYISQSQYHLGSHKHQYLQAGPVKIISQAKNVHHV